MSEVTGELKESHDTVAPKQEDIDIQTAREILEVLSNTPESTFTKDSDLSIIGGYNPYQIRQAFTKVAIDIIANSSMKDPKIKHSAIRHTLHGDAMIVVNYKVDREGKDIEPWGIWLSLSQGRKTIIDMSLNFEDIVPGTPGYKGYAMLLGFHDDRPNTISASAIEFYKEGNNQLTVFRKLFRGTRWIAANLLDWSGEFILPEELDHHALPSSNTRTIQPINKMLQ